MEVEKFTIGSIPCMLYGEKSDRAILACHGSHSSKIDDCIWILAKEATKKGYQVLSFDLPCHGERVYETKRLMPEECVAELTLLYDYLKKDHSSISLFGCSMGAYFELLTFAEKEIDNVFFLSPVVDMEHIIHNLMAYSNVTEEEFKERVEVNNDIEPLYYPYYEYVKNHPITSWPHKTKILRGEFDSMVDEKDIKDFVSRFCAKLTVQQGGEHWFHTTDELNFYRAWLDENL